MNAFLIFIPTSLFHVRKTILIWLALLALVWVIPLPSFHNASAPNLVSSTLSPSASATAQAHAARAIHAQHVRVRLIFSVILAACFPMLVYIVHCAQMEQWLVKCMGENDLGVRSLALATCHLPLHCFSHPPFDI